MIQVKDVGIRYQDWVLRNISFDVPTGGVMAILGPNGRGKSSLLRVMADVAKPTEGVVDVGGTVSYVPQFMTPGFDMTVKDLVLTGRARQIGWMGEPGKEDHAASSAALERLAIPHFASRYLHELSGGQRQLVMVARALTSGCQAMLLDEPASALDFHNQAIMLSVMQDLAASGMTLIFTTHLPQHALEIANKSLLLFNETDYLAGDTETTVTSQTLSRLYQLPILRHSITHDAGVLQTAVPIYRSLVRGS